MAVSASHSAIGRGDAEIGARRIAALAGANPIHHVAGRARQQRRRQHVLLPAGGGQQPHAFAALHGRHDALGPDEDRAVAMRMPVRGPGRVRQTRARRGRRRRGRGAGALRPRGCSRALRPPRPRLRQPPAPPRRAPSAGPCRSGCSAAAESFRSPCRARGKRPRRRPHGIVVEHLHRAAFRRAPGNPAAPRRGSG